MGFSFDYYSRHNGVLALLIEEMDQRKKKIGHQEPDTCTYGKYG